MILKDNYRISDLPITDRLQFMSKLILKRDHITNEMSITIDRQYAPFNNLKGHGYLLLRDLFHNLKS